MNIDVTRPRSFNQTAYSGSPPARTDTSIAGTILLTALAVALTILGVLLLGAVFVSAWWLLRHIPLPPILVRALDHL